MNDLPGAAPFSMGTHDSPGEHYGDHFGEDEHAPDVPLTRLQIFLQRSYAGWPLYTIIISAGQLLAAVSTGVDLLSSLAHSCASSRPRSN